MLEVRDLAKRYSGSPAPVAEAMTRRAIIPRMIAVTCLGVLIPQADEARCPCSHTVHLNPVEMRAHVIYVEPLELPGIRERMWGESVVVIQIAFGADGRMSCARVTSGHVMAISSLAKALPSWKFSAVETRGQKRGGCGTLRVRVKFTGDRAISTLQ